MYINTKGEIQKAPTSEKLYDFDNGVAFIKQGDKIGLINPKMEVVLQPKYDVIKPF